MKYDCFHPNSQNTSNEYFADQVNQFYFYNVEGLRIWFMETFTYASQADNCIWSNKFP